MTNPSTQKIAPNSTPKVDLSSGNLSLGSDGATMAHNNKVLIWSMVIICIVVASFLGMILGPNWKVDWHRYRSLSAEKRGDSQAAIKQLLILRAMPKTDPTDPLQDPAKDPSYLSELGYAYMNLKDYKSALEYFLKAQENRSVIPPDEQGNPRAPYDFSGPLGVVSFKLGDLAQAHKYLETAITTNKLDPASNFYMGELLLKENNLIKAASYYKVVAKNPQFEDQVKKRYAEIEQKLFGNIK